jgi:hypothetical protein
LFLSLASCDRDREIKVYKVAKEADVPAAPAADPHAGVPMPTPGEPDPHAGLGIGGASKPPGVTGEVPPAWEPGRGSSMRLASYVVRGEDEAIADISLIILGGGAGGLLDNVNRWRAQVKLPPVDDASLTETSSKMATPQGEGTVVDLQPASPVSEPAKDGRIVGVIVPLPNEIWFYKMRGNTALVEREKEGFLRWVATARKAEAPPVTADPQPSPPVSVPPSPQPPREISWQVPEGWREGPAKSMRVASFSVGANETPGEVSVIKLGGAAGGELANVNRWRGQIGLPPITAEVLASSVMDVESPAGTIDLVDCAGSDQRTLAGWLAHEGNTWFFKLSGPSAVVEAEQARFKTFLASLDFPAK